MRCALICLAQLHFPYEKRQGMDGLWIEPGIVKLIVVFP
jgi:hypothetical protein